MGLMKIRNELEKIEKVVFASSFKMDMSLGKLSKLYSDLIKIRDKFLRTRIIESTPKESEEIRYRIQENTLSVKIMIREKRKLNIDVEINELEYLSNLYE